MSAFLPFMIGSTIWDFIQNLQTNKLAEETRDDMADVFGRAEERLDAAGQALPSYQYNGQIYGGTSSNPRDPKNAGAINLDTIFNAGTAAQDAFKAMGLTPENVQVDLGYIDEGRSAVRGALDSAYAGINELLSPRTSMESLLAGVDLPDTDLSAVLSADLAGIGERSRMAQEQRTQTLASEAAMGSGLESQQGALRDLEFESGRDRALAGAGARAQNRMQEQDAQKFVSGLQFGASSLAEQLNTQRATTQAGAIGQLTGLDVSSQQLYDQLFGAGSQANIGNLTNLGTIEANLAGQAANDSVARYQALMGGIDRELQLALGQAGLSNNLAGAMAGFYQPIAMPQNFSLASYAPLLFPNQYMPQQPDSSGLDLGFGLGPFSIGGKV